MTFGSFANGIAMPAYTETDVSRITAAMSEAITATIAGQDNWRLVGELFFRFFPGAAFSFSNYNPHASVPCTAYGVNWDPDFVRSFEEHFHAMNPWTKYWEKRPAGDIMTSESVLPASTLKGRPFYEDWIKPQKDVDAGAGIKLKGEGGWVLHTAIHYPVRFAPVYDPAMVEILRRIRRTMTLAIDSSVQVANGWMEGATFGALAPMADKIGFVIDVQRHLHRATEMAERLLFQGSLCAISSGELRLKDRDADHWLGKNLHHFRGGVVWPVLPRIVEHQDGQWRADLWLLPKPPSMVPVVTPNRFLLVLTNLDAVEHHDGTAQLARLYRLTDAERRVCLGMGAGQTVGDFAETAGLSPHTVRSQLKSAMRKMDCHRQADLIARIVRYSQ